jgi:membrane associated rhomboid family serine protease
MAFLQSGSPREPFLRVPVSVAVLIGAIVAAHLARLLASDELFEKILVNFAFIPARYLPNAADPGNLLARAVPFVSYTFLHADWLHLSVNCLWLLAFGPVVARRFGGPLFLAFYFLCGIAGAATYLAFNWGSLSPVIGASGAISGLMAGGIRMLRLPMRFDDEPRQPLLPILSQQVVAFTVLWMGLNIVLGITGFGVGGEIRLMAWQAHIGGYLAGLFGAGAFDALIRRDWSRTA